MLSSTNLQKTGKSLRTLQQRSLSIAAIYMAIYFDFKDGLKQHGELETLCFQENVRLAPLEVRLRRALVRSTPERIR